MECMSFTMHSIAEFPSYAPDGTEILITTLILKQLSTLEVITFINAFSRISRI